MAWKECHRVSLREEFVALASVEAACMTTLCVRFGESRKTGYKWLGRSRGGTPDPLRDRPRRPRRFRSPTPPDVEARVVAARDLHPTWGGRKLHDWLARDGAGPVPAASTITAVLRRHGRLDGGPDAARPKRDWVRFEHPAPNDLWQMDFKGDFALADGRRCRPLTVLDDHPRYAPPSARAATSGRRPSRPT